MTAAETIELAQLATVLGGAMVAVSGLRVCALVLGDDDQELRTDLERRFPHASFVPASATAQAIARDAALAFTNPRAMPSLDPRGTSFQRRVWAALREVGRGETVTYRQLAQRIDSPQAVRAVASACGANPIAVLVPCHRVVRSDGGLGGYRWGIDRKRALLASERRAGTPLAA